MRVLELRFIGASRRADTPARETLLPCGLVVCRSCLIGELQGNYGPGLQGCRKE